MNGAAILYHALLRVVVSDVQGRLVPAPGVNFVDTCYSAPANARARMEDGRASRRSLLTPASDEV